MTNQHIFQPPLLTYMGMKVIVAGSRPTLQVSDSFEWCSDKFRAEMNAWLLQQFGHTSIIPRGQVYIIEEKTAVMHPDDYAMLKTAYFQSYQQIVEKRWRHELGLKNDFDFGITIP